MRKKGEKSAHKGKREIRRIVLGKHSVFILLHSLF